MLGFYQNFPGNVHERTTFTHSLSTKKLQHKLMETLFELNNGTFNFNEIACPTIPNGIINFEIGIAEENNFNFIDKAELQKTTATNKTGFQTMDFFWAIRYHTKTKEKIKPLKFDYFLLRLLFNERIVEAQVVHERGPRYVSPKDLVEFLVKKLNLIYQKKVIKPAKVE